MESNGLSWQEQFHKWMRRESGEVSVEWSRLAHVSKPGWVRRASSQGGDWKHGAAAALGGMSEPKWDEEGICMGNGAALAKGDWLRHTGELIK